MDDRSSSLGPAKVAAATVMVLLLSLTLSGTFGKCPPDFSSFYVAGRLSFSDQLYSRHAEVESYRDVSGCTDAAPPYNRPPYHAAALKLLSLLPYRAALGSWLFISLLASGLFVFLWRERPLITGLAIAWSYPLAHSIRLGQDQHIQLLSIAGALWAWRAGRPALVALFLIAGLGKPHYICFALLWLLVHFERRILASLVVGGAALLILCFVVSGPLWLLSWLSVAAGHEANLGREFMINLAGLGRTLHSPQWLVWVSAALLLGFSVYSVSRLTFPDAICLSPVLGILLSPHAYMYDAASCIPLALLVLQESASKTLKIIALLSVLPITFLFRVPPLYWPIQAILPCLAAAFLHFRHQDRRTPGERGTASPSLT